MGESISIQLDAKPQKERKGMEDFFGGPKKALNSYAKSLTHKMREPF
jgi:hypothetical protein